MSPRSATSWRHGRQSQATAIYRKKYDGWYVAYAVKTIINPLPSALIDLSPTTLTILLFCDVRLNVKLTKSMHLTC